MANRFIDTRFFKSPFVRSLQAPSKLLYTFIICECSPAGIWEKDLEAATLYTGTKQSEEDFAAFVSTGRAIEFQPGRIFFPDFILHQYPSGLQRQNTAHKNVIAELLKFNLLIENNEGALKPLESPLKGSKVMDKVTVKEKDKVKDTTQSREKKTEEPKQPKSENKQNSLLTQLEAIWGTFLQERHEVSYYPNGAERKALKEVGQKLAFQIKEHQRRTGKIDLRPEDEQVVEAWRYVLSHYDKWSSFNQQLTKITQINGQLTSIIAESKRDPSHQTKRNGKAVHHVTPEEAALALHRLHQERSARAGGDGQD